MAYRKSKARLLGDLFGKANLFTLDEENATAGVAEGSALTTSSGSSGTWSVITANTTLTAGQKVIVDTSAAVTLTFPASPSLGDEIRVVDGTANAATNNITLSGLINSANTFTMDANRAAIGFVYSNTAQGWVTTEV